MRVFAYFLRVQKVGRPPVREPAIRRACRNPPAKVGRPSGRNRKAPAGTGGGPVVLLWGEAAGRGSYFFIPRFFLIQRSIFKPGSTCQNIILITAIHATSNRNDENAVHFQIFSGAPARIKMI